MAAPEGAALLFAGRLAGRNARSLFSDAVR